MTRKEIKIGIIDRIKSKTNDFINTNGLIRIPDNTDILRIMDCVYIDSVEFVNAILHGLSIIANDCVKNKEITAKEADIIKSSSVICDAISKYYYTDSTCLRFVKGCSVIATGNDNSHHYPLGVPLINLYSSSFTYIKNKKLASEDSLTENRRYVYPCSDSDIDKITKDISSLSFDDLMWLYGHIVQ